MSDWACTDLCDEWCEISSNTHFFGSIHQSITNYRKWEVSHQQMKSKRRRLCSYWFERTRAGLSLIPSPTIATTYPSRWSSLILCCLNWGNTSEKT
jgi:hypothetical protein